MVTTRSQKKRVGRNVGWPLLRKHFSDFPWFPEAQRQFTERWQALRDAL